MTYKDFFKDVLLAEDLLPGGKGESAAPESVDPTQLAMGITVEMEHTQDERIAKEIALDHLQENPNYYSELQKAGLADELDAVGPSTGLGDPEHPINSKEHRAGNQEEGEDITPDAGNNILPSPETHKMDEPRDGESHLDKVVDIIKSTVSVGSEPTSDNKVEIGGTKPFTAAPEPTVGKNGGGNVDGTPAFGACEQRLMSLAGIKVLPVQVIGMTSTSPTTEPEQPAVEIEIDDVSPEEAEVEEKEEIFEKTQLPLSKKTTITGPGITSDMGKNRWSIPFGK
jgi:hypothetical protein